MKNKPQNIDDLVCVEADDMCKQDEIKCPKKKNCDFGTIYIEDTRHLIISRIKEQLKQSGMRIEWLHLSSSEDEPQIIGKYGKIFSDMMDKEEFKKNIENMTPDDFINSHFEWYASGKINELIRLGNIKEDDLK